MPRTPRYSRATTGTPKPAAEVASPRPLADPATAPAASPPTVAASTTTSLLASPRLLWSAWTLLALALLLSMVGPWRLRGTPITQQDIDRAVRHSLEAQPLPAATRKAADKILPSVVRVVGQLDDEGPRAAAKGPGKAPGQDGDKSKDKDGTEGQPRRGVGTGVVIVDSGLILTNFHVIHGARSVKVTFANGLESEARVMSVQPEQDLAVLKALQLPDDLQAATLRGSGDLEPGDTVVAVGYPFGIGPSVSAGVVSGLDREFRSPEGRQTLQRLIQFDAAANPGNSGGPLVNAEGEVVGIVTAILNPTEARTFIGIGFAVPIESAGGALGFPPF